MAPDDASTDHPPPPAPVPDSAAASGGAKDTLVVQGVRCSSQPAQPFQVAAIDNVAAGMHTSAQVVDVPSVANGQLLPAEANGDQVVMDTETPSMVGGNVEAKLDEQHAEVHTSAQVADVANVANGQPLSTDASGDQVVMDAQSPSVVGGNVEAKLDSRMHVLPPTSEVRAITSAAAEDGMLDKVRDTTPNANVIEAIADHGVVESPGMIKLEGSGDKLDRNPDDMKEEGEIVPESDEENDARNKDQFVEDRQGDKGPTSDDDDDSSGDSDNDSESDSSSDSCSEDESCADAKGSRISNKAENASQADGVLPEVAAALKSMEDEEEDAEAAPMRTKNEKDDDAIRIERPNVELSSSQKLWRLGCISGVMEKAVIVMSDAAEKITVRGQVAPGGVEAVRHATALDAGSVVWFEDGKMLGAVFETFGPVTAPFYTVRFNSKEEVDETQAAVGREVFYAEEMCCKVRAGDVQTKGYDSSNIFDEEAQGNQEEFSDDEAEAAAKRRRKRGNKQDGSQRGGGGGYMGAPKRARPGNRQGRNGVGDQWRENRANFGGGAYNGRDNFGAGFGFGGAPMPVYGSAPWGAPVYNVTPFGQGVPSVPVSVYGPEGTGGPFQPYGPSQALPQYTNPYVQAPHGWPAVDGSSFHRAPHLEQAPPGGGGAAPWPGSSANARYRSQHER